MRDHIHTGLVPFVYSGLAAIVMIHLLRWTAGQLAAHNATTAGKALGAFALAD